MGKINPLINLCKYSTETHVPQEGWVSRSKVGNLLSAELYFNTVFSLDSFTYKNKNVLEQISPEQLLNTIELALLTEDMLIVLGDYVNVSAASFLKSKPLFINGVPLDLDVPTHARIRTDVKRLSEGRSYLDFIVSFNQSSTVGAQIRGSAYCPSLEGELCPIFYEGNVEGPDGDTDDEFGSEIDQEDDSYSPLNCDWASDFCFVDKLSLTMDTTGRFFSDPIDSSTSDMTLIKKIGLFDHVKTHLYEECGLAYRGDPTIISSEVLENEGIFVPSVDTRSYVLIDRVLSSPQADLYEVVAEISQSENSRALIGYEISLDRKMYD